MGVSFRILFRCNIYRLFQENCRGGAQERVPVGLQWHRQDAHALRGAQDQDQPVEEEIALFDISI